MSVRTVYINTLISEWLFIKLPFRSDAALHVEDQHYEFNEAHSNFSFTLH